HQEAARRQGGQRARILLARLEIGGKTLGQLSRDHFVGGGIRVRGLGQRQPFGRKVGAHGQPRQFHRFAREGGKILGQKRQVEQPFAGIVNDVERQPPAREHAPPGGSGFIFDDKPQFGDGAGGIG